MKIPYIPEDSPFNQDQKAWLAGFMAGLQTRLLDMGDSAARAKPPIYILYGSQTGNAEGLARTAAGNAKQHGLEPVVKALDEVELEEFGNMRRVMIITSTYGEGEMPDNAQLFWEALSAGHAERIEEMSFGVLAIGDTGYDGFCEAGKNLDTRLEQLGAKRLLARVDCDVDFEEPANTWIEAALPLFAEVEGGPDEVAATPATEVAAPVASAYNRKNPYASALAVNRRLSGQGSGKEIRHYEFDLGDSGIHYEAGDALNVVPENNPELVSLILERLDAKADAAVAKHDQPLVELLARNFEISTPSRELIAAVEQRAGNEDLSRIVQSGDKAALEHWLWGKDVLDLLQLNPSLALSADEFVALLKPLQHRAYSISSSSLANPDRIHLTVASVRYASAGRQRGGVCSTYLADRVQEGDTAGIFLTTNKSFRVPVDKSAPVIMVGPGTGIAPFRAFLQERRASDADGRNWLFFGDQTRASDFIYEDELTAMMKDGVLNRLDLAFSRDQSDKIYVQTRMRENGKELYAWLQDGGHFYVCGDASRMAKDVDQALHDVVAEHGGLDVEGAIAYVNQLKRDKRYLRDVY
ncbi:sulfite reductase (NADPH) flavoprotein alpha-component [Methylobacillus rhizosphaerae]|uniref:assimilatory sulfite reductase (NADPH) n=1 Tax=Methylobacillus rhizosphaerae TaxID=551994 RepID=A0A238ZAK9_9PROT|nr:sulfite reductase subunit alpha [Methylobacillus rhizosphaerae]SNR80102.1 sulfite reductase (NADPH) flavoprotein alpha-component [Methylobacillus rhizosphaerae]